MNWNRLLGRVSFIISFLFFYLPLINFLYFTILSHEVYRKLNLNNDEFIKEYNIVLMVGNYPYLEIILISIAITLLILSKPSINKFLFYPTLIIQLFTLLINIFLYLFFGAN
jgi:hypothetical protein